MDNVERQGLLMLGMATAYLREAGWEIEQISDFVLQGYDYTQRIQSDKSDNSQ